MNVDCIQQEKNAWIDELVQEHLDCIGNYEHIWLYKFERIIVGW